MKSHSLSLSRLSPVLFILVLLLAACQQRGHRCAHATLKQAEELMNSRPDSALALLDSLLPYQNTFSKSLHMDFMLQRLNAQNKCDTVFRSDSIVKILVDYYSNHGTSNQRMLANYLAGRVYYDMGELPLSLQYYQNAIASADTTKANCDLYTLHAVYGQMAELFHAQFLPDDEMEALKAAEQCAWKDRDTLSALAAFNLRVKPYYLKNENDSVLIVLNHTRDLYTRYGHREMAARTLCTIISVFLDRGKYAEAHELMCIYEEESGLFDADGNIMPGREMYYYEKGRYALFEDKTDSATLYFTKLLKAKLFEAGYKGLLQVYKKRNEPDSVVKYASLYTAANDSSYLHVNQEAIHQISAMYNYNRLQALAAQETAKASRQKRDKIILFLLLSSAIVAMILINNKLRMRKMAQINQLLYEKSVVEQMLHKVQLEMLKVNQQSEEVMEEKNQEIKRLQNQLDEINLQLAQNSTGKAEDEFYEKNIFTYFEQHKVFDVNQQPPSEKHWRNFCNVFGRKFPQYYAFLTQEHQLTTDQLHVCILLRLGFNEGEMATVMGVDNKRISRIKAQVNRKIFNANNAISLKSNLAIHF